VSVIPQPRFVNKARRLVESGAVTRLESESFWVQGERDVYLVTLARNVGEDGPYRIQGCTCAGFRHAGVCSHIVAARAADG
jgi:uncharacterized Zn finger protein